MKLYVNGDSHAAAAEAVNSSAFAEDESQYFYLGRAPHPDNKKVSWSRKLADIIKAGLYLDAESASSNARIIRTTKQWLETQDNIDDVLVIIQWSTWERREWLIGKQYFQINASGIDDVPESHVEKYKEFVRTVDWDVCTARAHDDIWAFHNELNAQNIKHIFFNGNNSFNSVPNKSRKDWGASYIAPYSVSNTFDSVLRANGFETVAPNSYHYGKESHRFWAKHMLQYINENKMV